MCPFHHDTSPSLSVDDDKSVWHCFSCQKGGGIKALLKLAGLGSDDVPASRPPPVEKAPYGGDIGRLYAANEEAARYYHNMLVNSYAGAKAMKYLADRGISLKTITDFQVGYSLNSWDCLKHTLGKGYTEDELLAAGLVTMKSDRRGVYDRFRDRVMFPIMGADGEVMGFGARSMDSAGVKYTNSLQTPIFNKKSVLYGMHKAKEMLQVFGTAVIVEGYMDVLTAHQHGFDNVVAPMGTAITEEQMGMLSEVADTVILAFDADQGGESALRRCEYLGRKFSIDMRVALLPAGKDPDDVIREDAEGWRDLMRGARLIGQSETWNDLHRAARKLANRSSTRPSGRVRIETTEER